MSQSIKSPRIFISYARKDGDELAHKLRERIELEQPEITIWQDRVRLEGGVGWWAQITEALDQVEFMVLVMTPAAIESAIIKQEWRYARQQGVCVYPVVADALIDFGSLPRWMSKTHFFDLQRDWETFINYLKSPCRVTRVPFMAPDLPEAFVDRRTLFGSVLKTLTASDRQNLALTTALHGAGGLGKTTLAAALCHNDETITTFDDGILWITLGKQPNIHEGLTKLYAALTGERPDFVDDEDAAFHLAEKLEQKNCLIVIDDAWDIAHLRPFMRGGSGCVRLITTRIFDVGSEAVRFNVDVMTADEAVQLLTTHLPHSAGDTPLFRDVAERLDKWPLLLEMAGATLRHRINRGDTLEGALGYLNRKLDKQGVVAFDKRNAIDRHQAIGSTIEISLELLDASERESCTELAIFPEDDDIPLEVITELWSVDEFEAEELVQKLDNVSLLKFNLQAATIRLHDVVRSYLSTQLAERDRWHLKLTKTWGDPHSLPHIYAWRWLSYHMVEAGQSEELQQLLLDFAWLQKKLDATNAISLMTDYERVVANDRDVNFVMGAIRLSAHVIALDKKQFAGQLLARLPYNKSARIDDLRNQAAASQDVPWLRPLMPLLTQPGGPLLFTLAGHTARVRAVAITDDGKQAVSASDDHTLKVWDLARGAEIHTLKGHTDWVRAVAIFPNTSRAVSASDDHTLRLWNIERGTLDTTVDHYGDWIRKLVVTPDGRYAISASDDRTLKIWDLEMGIIMLSLKGHTGGLNALAITTDGRFLLSGSDDRTIRVWDVEQGTQVRMLKGHRAKVNALAISPNGRQFVSASADNTLRLWDMEQLEGIPPRTITDEAHWVKDLAFTHDGRRVIAASEDKTLRIWNLERETEEPALEGHTDWVNSVAVSNDGQYAVSASDDRTVKVWDFNHQAEQSILKAHTDRVRVVTVTPDGQFAISVSDDGSLVVWDTQCGAPVRTLTGFDYWVMAVTRDSGHIISAHNSTTLKVWDLKSGNRLSTLSGHTDRVRALTVTPDGQHAVSAGDDRTIRLWDIWTGEEKLRIHVKAHWVRGLAVTPDGHYVMSASDRRSLKLWSLKDGSEIRTFTGHTARVNAVAVDPSGRLAISASDDHTLRGWNVDTGTALHEFIGHSASVNAVTIGQHGQHAISVSSDNTLKVWNLAHGNLITTFTAESPLLTCAFSPLESTIIAGDQSGNVHFLRLEEPKTDLALKQN